MSLPDGILTCAAGALAPLDGYTLLPKRAASFITGTVVTKKFRIDPLKNCAPIAVELTGGESVFVDPRHPHQFAVDLLLRGDQLRE